MQEDHLNAQMNAMIIQQNETKSCPFSSAGLDCPIKARQLLEQSPKKSPEAKKRGWRSRSSKRSRNSLQSGFWFSG